jgi:hypothetical protein
MTASLDIVIVNFNRDDTLASSPDLRQPPRSLGAVVWTTDRPRRREASN